MHATRKNEKNNSSRLGFRRPGAMRSHKAWFRELRPVAATQFQTMKLIKNVELYAKYAQGGR